ncbi:MAG: cell envelope integrity protein CreD [Burkholderiaceae bacterium]|nr:cell envelope integrity protein CreD [Aquabacterium sp.]NUP87725.1 cell envelope integrity protein CreD [Burkholderiaceae bacterium]
MRFPLLSKALSIGAVLGLVSLALMRIGHLVDERQGRQAEAVRSVEQSHAGAQTLAGPWLARSCVEEWDTTVGEGRDRKTQTERREWQWRLAPDRLQADGELRGEPRRRGLYTVHAYGATLKAEATWTTGEALESPHGRPGVQLHCGPLRVVLSLVDARGVREATLHANGQVLTVAAGTDDPQMPRGLQAELPAGWEGAPSVRAPALRVSMQLRLAGTARLAWVPAAGQTEWRLKSDWPHPSFGGRFLPVQHMVTAQGFDAQWKVSALASPAAADLARGARPCPVHATDPFYDSPDASRRAAPACLDTLSVRLFDPVNPYVLADRAIKYGLLFVVLTFVAVALVEVLAARRVHPVQYLLVGLALSVFFLLLLSLSEHLPFAQAYAAAALACALLLATYAAAMLGRARAGVFFGIGIAVLYGLLYALLKLEHDALAVGSVALFAALAAVMTTTRRIDWYALFDSVPGRSQAVSSGA